MDAAPGAPPARAQPTRKGSSSSMASATRVPVLTRGPLVNADGPFLIAAEVTSASVMPGPPDLRDSFATHSPSRRAQGTAALLGRCANPNRARLSSAPRYCLCSPSDYWFATFPIMRTKSTGQPRSVSRPRRPGPAATFSRQLGSGLACAFARIEAHRADATSIRTPGLTSILSATAVLDRRKPRPRYAALTPQ